MATHRMEVTVRWGETDAAGIVYYPNFFAWFDQATMEIFEALDPPFSQRVRANQEGLPIVEARCRFLLPVTYLDRLEIVSQFTEIRQRSFRMDHAVYRGTEHIAEGHVVRVFARYDSAAARLYPQPLTPEMRALMEA